MTGKVGLCFHEKMRQYDLGEGHPFRGDRFDNAIDFFRRQGLLENTNVCLIKSEPATADDLFRVHTKDYVSKIFECAEMHRAYDVETPVSPQILEAALLICGGTLSCGSAVFEGQVAHAVSLGGGHHHAGKSYGGGFCLFNDVALLVEFLKWQYSVERVLILDHDVHFGNGTSDIFYEDPSVLYISLHQDPRTIYPGTGFVWQIGRGKGEGFNVNVPLPPGTGDDTYLYALEEIFVPLAEEFQPQVVITNGGSDPHFADMLGNLKLTVKGFSQISRLIHDLAEKICHGRLVMIPGSGYNPKVLPACWYALIVGLLSERPVHIQEPGAPETEPRDVRRTVENTLDDLKRHLRRQWSSFGGYSLNTTP